MISYILFDLDNTLYPESSPLGRELSRRINKYAADFIGVSEEEALRLRRAETKQYGTTMRWLAQQYGLTDLNHYIESVHPLNVGDFIQKDEELKLFLHGLTLPMSVLTNSPASHARRVLEYLEIEDCFERVFDLNYSSFRGKPHRETYESVLAAIDRSPAEAMFVDDVPSYLLGYREIGGVAVLVDETGTKIMDDPEVLRVRKVTEIARLLDAA
ncbi:MAG TPA: HAD-IA family hydrolase [Spirochaetia bacterium]|nr:HAD-IA family hydrolase [Spirochaetia bacterium]